MVGAGTGPYLREEITAGEQVTVADALGQRARILNSEALRQSDVLKAIFSFVSTEAVKGNLSAVKEYTIATEVLHQPAEFDGRASNLVRVHANRLRQRLQVYYAGEGEHDPIIVRLPKGSYVPQFAHRAKPSDVASPEPHLQLPEGSSPPPARLTESVLQPAVPLEDPTRTKVSRQRRLAFAVALVLAGFLAGLVPSMIYVTNSSTGPVTKLKPGSNLYRFWKPFLAADSQPIIVLGQRRFLLTSTGAYLPFAGPQSAPTGTWIDSVDTVSEFSDRKLLEAAGRLQFADAITGLGDAEAAFLLCRTFLDLRTPATLRKSRLLRVEDLRTNNIVFLGASAVNPLLNSAFDNAAYQCGQSADSLRPANVSGVKERDPKTGELMRDIGRIWVLPGLADGRKTIVLAGGWTYGTLAAARFCADEKHLSELLEFPGFSRNGSFPEYFQAVVSGDLVQGELGRVRLVTARAINCGRESGTVSGHLHK